MHDLMYGCGKIYLKQEVMRGVFHGFLLYILKVLPFKFLELSAKGAIASKTNIEIGLGKTKGNDKKYLKMMKTWFLFSS